MRCPIIFSELFTSGNSVGCFKTFTFCGNGVIWLFTQNIEEKAVSSPFWKQAVLIARDFGESFVTHRVAFACVPPFIKLVWRHWM